jgi:hypothetical protein
VLFIAFSLGLILASILLIEYDFKHFFAIVFILASALVISRRIYLGLKPWWGGKISDISKYFKAP